jgi:hypothetical protein
VPEKKEPTVKTSLRLPERLWKAAHVLALDERSDLQDVVAKALEAYLLKRGRLSADRPERG